MGKYLNIDTMEEVEAFSKEELDAKLNESKEAWAKEMGVEDMKTRLAEIEKDRDEVKSNYEKLSKVHESQKESLAKLKETLNNKDKSIEEVSTEKKQAFEKIRDTRIKEIAKDDKEYEEALRSQFDRLGSETLDVDEINKRFKEAHVLALTNLERDVVPFNPGAMGSHSAPVAKPAEDAQHEKRVNELADYAANLMGIKKAE